MYTPILLFQYIYLFLVIETQIPQHRWTSLPQHSVTDHKWKHVSEVHCSETSRFKEMKKEISILNVNGRQERSASTHGRGCFQHWNRTVTNLIWSRLK